MPPVEPTDQRRHLGDAAYGRPFWLLYAGNTLLMVAISLLFRYADFVAYAGGTEWHLGWIAGVGMSGSLVMRWWLGAGIDRIGARRIWLWSLALFAVVVAAHVLVGDVRDPTVYGLRILFCIAIAGAFGSSITYVSRTVPPTRVAEIIGTLGSSGFVGMFFGPEIGDRLMGHGPITRGQIDQMFLIAAGLSVASWACIWMATRRELPPKPRRHLPTWPLIRKYQPGWVLLVGVAMGIGVAMPGVFLRTYTAELDIPRMKLFFQVYTVTAFTMRMATRRLPERLGNRPFILLGMASLIGSVLLYLAVDSYFMLALPAVLAGTSHAFLFPAVVAAGTTAFPVRHRGVGTTLILAMFDIGALVGPPLIGGVLHMAGAAGWPPYPTMFVLLAGLLTAATLAYVVGTPRTKAVAPGGDSRAATHSGTAGSPNGVAGVVEDGTAGQAGSIAPERCRVD